MTTRTRLIAIAIFLRFDLYTSAATLKLKPETVAAWDAYLQAANDRMQARLQPGAHFLWLDEEPGRAEKIRTKGPYIAPLVKDIPRKVPSGLIHDWCNGSRSFPASFSRYFPARRSHFSLTVQATHDVRCRDRILRCIGRTGYPARKFNKESPGARSAPWRLRVCDSEDKLGS